MPYYNLYLSKLIPASVISKQSKTWFYTLGRDHSNIQNNDTAYRRAGFKGGFVDKLYTIRNTFALNILVNMKNFFFSMKNIA